MDPFCQQQAMEDQQRLDRFAETDFVGEQYPNPVAFADIASDRQLMIEQADASSDEAASRRGQHMVADDQGVVAQVEELERVDDAVTLAQKILSTVVRVGQSWGVGHVIDVLRGRTTDRVTVRRHQELSTFGLLADVPIAELRGYVDQLTEQQLLQRTDGPYPVLQLTDDGAAALKGLATIELFRQPRPAPGQRKRRPPADPAAWDGVDRELFETLRQCRLEVARARGVPPYVVFHDNTLRDLARRRPTTPQELVEVYGIGARKAEDLGPIILEVIREFRGEPDSDIPEQDVSTRPEPEA